MGGIKENGRVAAEKGRGGLGFEKAGQRQGDMFVER